MVDIIEPHKPSGPLNGVQHPEYTVYNTYIFGIFLNRQQIVFDGFKGFVGFFDKSLYQIIQFVGHLCLLGVIEVAFWRFRSTARP